MATKIPDAVATKASLIAGAITPSDADELPPKLLKVSSMDTTVPKSPMNGEVEDMIESQDKPTVASFSDKAKQTFKSFGFKVSPELHFFKIESFRTFFAPISIEFKEAFSRPAHEAR